MSELSKLLQGAATPDQIAELLAEVFVTAKVEIPSSPDGWEHHYVRLAGAVRHGQQAVECVDGWQKANDNMRKF